MRSEIIRGREGRREKIVVREAPDAPEPSAPTSDAWRFVLIAALLAGFGALWLRLGV